MANGHVEYSLPFELLPLVSKSSSFESDKFPVNNNPNISISLSLVLSSGFSGSGVVLASQDDSTWFELTGTTATITGDDDVLWTLSELQSIMYLKVGVTIDSGSGIMARGT